MPLTVPHSKFYREIRTNSEQFCKTQFIDSLKALCTKLGFFANINEEKS